MTTTTANNVTPLNTTDELRERYRKALWALTYDNADKATAQAKIAEVAQACAERRELSAPTPALWVRAAESCELPCGRCAGTGRFITYVENGVPKGPGGPCYRCDGKGYQTAADGARNYGADRQQFARACRQMMA